MTRIRGFLIDLDGVLYTGDTVIPGAAEAVRFLETQGYAYRFVSNTTRKSRRTIVQRLGQMGIHIPESSIFTPPVAAVAFMKKHKKTRFRLLITGDARIDFPQSCDAGKDAVPDYVIVGDAGDEFTYRNLNLAFRDLIRGAELIALEKDRYWMAQDGLSLSAGPYISALEYATGKTATIVGKPSSAFFELALNDMGIAASNAVMIGDDITTDVGGAQAAGMRGVLVRTGKFREDAVRSSPIRPDHIIDSIAMIEQIVISDYAGCREP
jgi:HAD superfamily hydrolase (TIGR01458 family)